MIDPKVEIATQALAVAGDVAMGNYPAAIASGRKLVAMLEAFVVPPIEAPSLDPSDRAAVDAEVDAEIPKP